MLELIVRDLIFSTEDSTKTFIASSRVGKAASGSEVEAGEDEEGGLVLSRFRMRVMVATHVGGVGIAEGEGVVYSSCGFD